MPMLSKLSLSIGLLGLIYACTKETPIPSYIYLEEIKFQPQNSTTQGGTTSKILDAWIWVDDQLIGANTLPMTIPILHNDETSRNSIKIAAGIKDNGIGNTRLAYPFYARYEISRNLEGGKTDTLSPIIGYNDATEIIVVDNFENPGVVFGHDVDNNPETDIIKIASGALEGNYSGKFVFSETEAVCELATSVQYPKDEIQPPSLGASAVYLELDYQTNVPLFIGLGTYYRGQLSNINYQLGLNPQASWNKAYINLTEEVLATNADSYVIGMKASKNDSISSPQILVDNIKLLHY